MATFDENVCAYTPAPEFEIPEDPSPGGLPDVTAEDNGKVLMVVNGSWQAGDLSTIYDNGDTAEYGGA